MIIEDLEDLDRLDISDIEAESAENDDPENNLRYRMLPDEWVALILGPKGSGKSAYLARGNARALRSNQETFTNLWMNTEYLASIGITKESYLADFDDIVRFNPAFQGAWIGIDEITTWLVRQRAMANAQILADNWLGQIRKLQMKMAFTAQFGRKITEGLLEQVDLIIHARDACWTDWGWERQLDRGRVFIYTCKDNSGIFTGRIGTTWGFVLREADKLWKLYNTYQQQDPATFMRKYEFVGEKQVIDLDTNETYDASEMSAMEQEKALGDYGSTLSMIWNSKLMNLVTSQPDELNIQETPGKVGISINRIETAISSATGKDKAALKSGWKFLKDLARKRSPVVAQDATYIWVLKPEVLVGDM